jgi:hypothetical protein
MKSKMGRPKLPKGKQRQVFSTRFTRDEIAQFARAARRAKQTLREWIASTLTDRASQS